MSKEDGKNTMEINQDLSTVWLPLFFKISSLMSNRRNKFIQQGYYLDNKKLKA